MLGELHAPRFHDGEYLAFTGRQALQPLCYALAGPTFTSNWHGSLHWFHEL